MTFPRNGIPILPTVFLALCLSASAQSHSHGMFNVRDYGATGDGTTLDSPAINRAIATAADEGGGTVLLPAGTYLSYSIRLRSHITLRLDSGATIIAADPPPSGEPGGYDAPEENPADLYQDFGHSHWHNSLIWGEELNHVAIVGQGIIFGRGLSQGRQDRKAPFPRSSHNPEIPTDDQVPSSPDIQPGPFGYPARNDGLPAGVGNKAIALKNCRNVTLRDFTILHGGHFGILATGVDNLTIDNLTIDTNRDGIDIDACTNVRVANCLVNSPFDDGICLKSSFALGETRLTENVVITNCIVTGFDEGTLLDGTRQRSHRWPNGRIKLGTEATGGFRNIAITNCVLTFGRGLALEQVDGGVMEDVTIDNIILRDIINAPIFVRLGARLRGPAGTTVGSTRRIRISNVTGSNIGLQHEPVTPHGIFLVGTPGADIEDLVLRNIRLEFVGGGERSLAEYEVPELADGYPEPGRWGRLPAWGIFARHLDGLELSGIDLRTRSPDKRHAVILDDITDLRWRDVVLPTPAPEAAESVVLREVDCLNPTDLPAPPR